ncbi:hypothetical protein [Pseudomonas silensiensis]
MNDPPITAEYLDKPRISAGDTFVARTGVAYRTGYTIPINKKAGDH